ncbi:MAG: hydroxymethylbilane synthase [Planctomycetota bacterium]|nr:hydroxymethylbilane synthase [Planctomycetota bacterium]
MTSAPSKIVLATRGSALALWQAETTARALRAGRSDLAVDILTVKSGGDRDQTTELARFGRTGIFTAEVDAALFDRRAHVGVHSLKDVPTELPVGLVLGGVLMRGPAEDVLVSRNGVRLAELPHGARVATGSVRRAAMLRRLRPDLTIVAIRGNVDTRLAKLDRGEADAIVLARAGLERLGLGARITQILTREESVPAPSQGIVGLICRIDDDSSRRHLDRICDRESAAEALAERALLNGLHGGCNAPLGAHARARDNVIALTARVLSLDGKECIEDRIQGSIDEAEALGRALAERMAAAGAKRLIDAARVG